MVAVSRQDLLRNIGVTLAGNIVDEYLIIGWLGRAGDYRARTYEPVSRIESRERTHCSKVSGR